MRTENLIESQSAILALSDAEAASLRAVGRRLASDKGWWGQAELSDDRTVIQCTPQGDGLWTVRVSDAVGLISVGSLQLEIRPKIPLLHLLFLLGESGRFPRLDDQLAQSMAGASLWELVAKWYLNEMEKLLRRDLMRDYQAEGGWVKVIRGRVHPTSTLLATASGRPEALCEFEEFGADTPLNRILLAGAHVVARSPALSWDDRRRAKAIATRMDGVTSLAPSDLRARPDRRTAYYGVALGLARHMLAGQGRTGESGQEYAQTFLIRTPEMIEDGIRHVLQQRVEAEWRVEKKGRQLVGSSLTFNPDLVINDGLAVADVKYKWSSKDWARPDLYQIVAFATQFQAELAALIGFKLPTLPSRPSIRVGRIRLQTIDWEASEQLAPQEAAARMGDDFQHWLSSWSGESEVV